MKLLWVMTMAVTLFHKVVYNNSNNITIIIRGPKQPVSQNYKLRAITRSEKSRQVEKK